MFQLIANSGQLSQCIADVVSGGQVAFDLEFDRDRHTYGFDLCLLQMGTAHSCYLIDPLTLDDLRPVFDFFENPAVQKLVHCPGEDLRLLHALGCYPQNIADTEVMAKLLNYEHTSLAKLLENKLGIILNKKQQQSNWHNRPLLPEQLKYAADDVIHLPALYNLLMGEIVATGKENWVQQENDWLQQVRYTLEKRTYFLKPADEKNLSPWHAFVTNQLFKLRDELAQHKNKPAFMILPEKVLRDIGLELTDYRLPLNIPGLHPALRHGKAAEAWIERLDAIWEQAKGLSKQVEKKVFSESEKAAYYALKNRQIELKQQLWQPVQEQLVLRHGTYTARYILSNSWVTKWLNGDVCWHELQPGYKQQLVLQYAPGHIDAAAWIKAYETALADTPATFKNELKNKE